MLILREFPRVVLIRNEQRQLPVDIVIHMYRGYYPPHGQHALAHQILFVLITLVRMFVNTEYRNENYQIDCDAATEKTEQRCKVLLDKSLQTDVGARQKHEAALALLAEIKKHENTIDRQILGISAEDLLRKFKIYCSI